jgi:hypothetical protein
LAYSDTQRKYVDGLPFTLTCRWTLLGSAQDPPAFIHTPFSSNLADNPSLQTVSVRFAHVKKTHERFVGCFPASCKIRVSTNCLCKVFFSSERRLSLVRLRDSKRLRNMFVNILRQMDTRVILWFPGSCVSPALRNRFAITCDHAWAGNKVPYVLARTTSADRRL